MKALKQVIKRLINATRYSLDGLKVMWVKQQAFRLEVYVTVLLQPVIYLLPIPGILQLLLELLLLLLLLVETVNSSIEAAIDRISRKIHPLSKEAKDSGSAAVLIAIVMNIVAWVYAFSWCF